MTDYKLKYLKYKNKYLKLKGGEGEGGIVDELYWIEEVQLLNDELGKDGKALEFASETMKNTESIVKRAVEQNGMALEFASDRLKGDIDVVLTAVRQNGNAIIHAKRDAKKDPAVLDARIKQLQNQDQA